jgi:hypothetical protein
MKRLLLFLVLLVIVAMMGPTALAGQPDLWLIGPNGSLPVDGRVFVIPGNPADGYCRVQVSIDGLTARGIYFLEFGGAYFAQFTADDTGAFTFRFHAAPDAQCLNLQPTIVDLATMQIVGIGHRIGATATGN